MRKPGLREKLESLLKRAYLARDYAEIGTGWQQKLMARVREIGPLSAEARFLPLFEQFVWRLVPAACLLVLVLIALLATSHTPSGDPLQLLLNDMEESVFTQLLGA